MKQQRVTPQYLPVFCQELHQLVKSGIPLAEGLAMLRDDEKEAETRALLGELNRLLEDGMPLASALRETGVFPEYMSDMVALAEETGRLEEVLQSLRRHYERQLRMAADIRGAVAVPAALFIVMVAVVVLLVTQVLPVFDKVFAQLGRRMSMMAVGMMNAGAALARAGTAIGAVLVVIAAAALVIGLTPALREKFAAWFRRNFGGRGILGQMATARFASSMSMAVSSGLSMEESVRLSAKLCGGSKEIDAKTERCRKELEEGMGPADALARSGLFSGRDCRLLKLAEQTGSLPDTLEDLARRQEEESQRRIDRTVGAIEPVIVVITSVLAGVILLSVMLPLMGLLNIG